MAKFVQYFLDNPVLADDAVFVERFWQLEEHM